MNWFDVCLVILVGASAFWGMRIGLIGAGFSSVGIVFGWLVAGQLSENIGGGFDSSLSNDTGVTVIAYVILIIVALIAARFIEKIVRPILAVMTVGLSSVFDKLGGFSLGILIGFVISGAIIVAGARLAYNFQFPEEGITGKAVDKIDVRETKELIENSLIDSTIVPVFVKVTDAIPASTLGFIPSDFRISLDILEQNIE